MSSVQLKEPKSKPQAEVRQVKGQRQFGLLRLSSDVPSSQIGDSDVSELKNMNLHPEYGEGRTGSINWGNALPPALPGRTGYTTSRIGKIVTVHSGAAMQPGDIYGRYLVWKTGERDEIIRFIDDTHFETRQEGDRAQEPDGYISGAGFGREFFEKTKKIITQWDSRLFISDWKLSRYTEIQNKSFELLAEAPSVMKAYENNVFVWNNNGKFKVALDSSQPYFYKINAPVPNSMLTDVDKSDTLVIGRRYLYSMTRLVNGVYHGNRTGIQDNDNVPVLKLEQDSGTTLFNTEESKDYGVDFGALHIGLGNETYGVLTGATGGVGVGIMQNIANWVAIGAIGTFDVNINGQGVQTAYCNFTNVANIEDVRRIIEIGLQALLPSATVTIGYDAAGDSFWILSTGKIDGSTISLATASGFGTDISNVTGAGAGIRGTVGAGAVLDNAANYTAPREIGNAVCASIEGSSPETPQYHPTHITFWSSLDPDGKDPTTRKANNPEQYIYNDDVPVMKAFTVHETSGNVLRCSRNEGLFSYRDPGNVVNFEDSDDSTIQFLSDRNGNRVYTPTSRYAVGDGGNISKQSATLGATHTLTIKKTGFRVKRKSGTRVFRASDVRKPLYCADGDIITIREFVDVDTVNAYEFGNKNKMAAAIDPSSRVFNDTTTDQRLRDRLENFSAQLRQYTHLPEGNIGTIVPGFLMSATRGDTRIYYSSMRKLFRTGYYKADLQFDDKIKDVINSIETLPDKAAVFCDHSVWITATNAPLLRQIPSWAITIATLPSMVLMDNIGCIHVGTIQEIDIGKLIMVTSESKVRIFDGTKFQEFNLSEKQVEDILKRASVFNVSFYSPYMGWVVWFALEQ